MIFISLCLLVILGISAAILIERHRNDTSTVAVQPTKAKESKHMIHVLVTYTDGTQETFLAVRDLILSEGGSVIIHTSHDSDDCTTISGFAYRKIEEKPVTE